MTALKSVARPHRGFDHARSSSAGCASLAPRRLRPAARLPRCLGNSALATLPSGPAIRDGRHDSVVANLHLLVQRAEAGRRGQPPPARPAGGRHIGNHDEGRAMPYVILARPMVHSAREAHDSGRPVVYVEANIHAGESRAKRRCSRSFRDLACRQLRPHECADSIVLIVEPIYNADGNDHFAPQSVNRREQKRSELVGERPNGQHLDLNRDSSRRSSRDANDARDVARLGSPTVFVDLHTTDGSFPRLRADVTRQSLNPDGGVHWALHTRLIAACASPADARPRHIEVFD